MGLGAMIFKLYYEFFKVGLFSIGGGLATIPFLQDLGNRTGWFNAADIADMIAISESTPGPIGINMATYTGFKTVSSHFGALLGILGGVISTLGLITPAIIVIFIVAKILDAFKDNKYVQSAFYGLRPASIGLIVAAGYGVVKISLINTSAKSPIGFFNIKAIILAVALYLIQKFFPKLHPICLIAIGALVGIVFGF